MKPKNLLFLIWYSVRDILLDIIRLIEALKKPKTWSFILYATLFLMAYYRKLTITNAIIIIFLILVIYIARQKKDPEFNKAVKEKAFIGNEEDKIQEYYETYKKQCYFTIPRKEPLSYEGYKQKELENIREKKEDISD